jgi:hypothetical protein
MDYLVVLKVSIIELTVSAIIARTALAQTLKTAPTSETLVTIRTDFISAYRKLLNIVDQLHSIQVLTASVELCRSKSIFYLLVYFILD